MTLLLNIVYLLLLACLSPWLLLAAWRQGKYREGYAAKLLGLVPHRAGPRPCIWLHAVSVGEVNLLQTLLGRLEASYPDWDCVISTTTKTGYELACRKYAPRMVFYCPLDFSWAVRTALRRIRPDLLVLAELELWPNLMRAAKEHGAKLAIINGRLSERSFRGYRRIRYLLRSTLRCLDLVAAQNDEYAARFRALGVADAVLCVTGSVKFDGAQTNRDNPATQKLAHLAGVDPRDVVFLAGSTQDPEESLAIETYRTWKDTYPELRLILVPRHPARCDELARTLDNSRLSWQRRSRLEADGPLPGARILLVDTVGELGAWWGTAHLAFVGGSLGSRGGQNMIEPAAYGAAVSFGPNTRNFRDIVALMLRHDAARVVHDGQELSAFVGRCLEDRSWANALGQRARELVANQRGATDRTVTLVANLLRASGRAAPARSELTHSRAGQRGAA
jgi:3-deoxy-D-manno-octulosonic-acid transferase